MTPSILASTVFLRGAFRRLRGAALLEGYAALGLFPLLIYAPRPAWIRILLVLSASFYLVRKIHQFFLAHQALKQFCMEEQFMRQSCDTERLFQCIVNRDHFWMRSRILRVLRVIFLGALVEPMLVEERRDHVLQQYHQSFRGIWPGRTNRDLWLLLFVVLVLASAPLIPVDPAVLMFPAGLVAILLAVLLEVMQTVLQRRIAFNFEQLYEALIDWTLSLPFDEMRRRQPRRAYTHTLLYLSQPWFAGASKEVPSAPGTLDA